MNVLAASDSWERWVLLAPALVIGGGIVVAVIILLARAFADSIRAIGHPRWVAGGVVFLLGMIVLLTYLGISLPRE